MKRVLRYVCGTTPLGIQYSGEESLNPIGYRDSDWRSWKINRKSTSGYVFAMAGGAVSWKSKKQGCIALPSCEAEYMALASSVKEAIWLRNIFGFITSQSKYSPILLQVENQGAIKVSKNDSFSTRTKHIDIQYHFVRDSLSKNLFSIQYCPTSEMAVDILTRPLQSALHEQFRSDIGLNSGIPLQSMWKRGSVSN